jgi:hypothetical protein
MSSILIPAALLILIFAALVWGGVRFDRGD